VGGMSKSSEKGAREGEIAGWRGELRYRRRPGEEFLRQGEGRKRQNKENAISGRAYQVRLIQSESGTPIVLSGKFAK
jgi:hypothetical protein